MAGVLNKLASKKRLRVAGLMSGTSADGVDAAITDIDGKKVSLLAFDMFRYPSGLRRAIFSLFNPETARLEDICHYNFVLGEFFAETVKKLCAKNGIDPGSIDLIGSHGQTIYHQPHGRKFAGRKVRSTLQIAEPSVIAQRTGITTIADFRPRDLAAGGHGAPLVPYADYILFGDGKIRRAIQNIGGIGNVTFLPAGSGIADIIAFDTGPGNMVIDGVMELITGGKKHYDSSGRLAKKGRVDMGLLKELLKHPFFKRRPPKSTGREEFGKEYCSVFYKSAKTKGLDNADIAATATALTAASIAGAYRKFLPAMPDEVVICGGGAHNKTLVKMLKDELAGSRIRLIDEFGISCDAKEAVSFAILAYAAIMGQANNVPGSTGAAETVVLGKIIPA